MRFYGENLMLMLNNLRWCQVKAWLVLSVCLISSSTVAAPLLNTSIEKLSGRIIRSLSVAPFDSELIIAGNKGKNAGDATLFASDNGGISWRFLNQGRSLNPAASDVQAVHYLNPRIVLAGTWKHGLYRSIDAGNTFARVNGFPSTDVRSIAVDQRNASLVYVGTGADGVFKSTDAGVNWQATSLNKGYIWSLRINANGDLLASSPSSGLYSSNDGGKSWKRSLQSVKASDAVVSASQKVVAVAAEDGLYVSRDGGEQWVQPAKLNGLRLSSVQFDIADANMLWLGDWGGGVWKYSLSDNSVSQSHAGVSVLHIAQNTNSLLLGSWGKGLRIQPRSESTSHLIEATKAGDAGIVRQLLRAGSDPDVFDRARNTSLIFAARDGQLEIADLLIQSAANANWIDGEGVTPLILAAHKNHPAVVELLLKHKADVNVVDGFGRTAIEYAARRGNNDAILKMLQGRR